MENNNEQGERQRPTAPTVYVASLSDYNDGHLHGRWINADLDPADIQNAIDDMLTNSVTPQAEEWAVHDHDGFGPLHLPEYMNVETISKLGAGIRDHGIAFAHWAAHVGLDDSDGLDRFENHYLGQWESMEQFAEELLDDFGIEAALGAIATPFRWYIKVDTKAFARDLAMDYVVSEGPDGVYLWDQR